MNSEGSPAPTTLASWCATIVRALDAQGVDGHRLAQAAGIDPAALLEPDGRVPRVALSRLWQLAVEATGDPCFGLTAARFMAQTSVHALGYAMLASTSLHEAFARLVRFRRIIGDVNELSIEPLAESYRFVIDVSAPPGAPFEAVDAFASACARVARTLRGDRRLGPIAVLLRRPEPRGSEAFGRTFRAPVAFGQAVNALEYSRAQFDELLPTGNAELARQNDEVVARYLARLAKPDLSRRVQRILLESLPDGPPRKQVIARKLGMSARNLQRRLEDEGSSFQDLLTEARATLAQSYIASGRHSITEIAFLLGFADASTFSRAFKRWTGKSPSDFAAS